MEHHVAIMIDYNIKFQFKKKRPSNLVLGRGILIKNNEIPKYNTIQYNTIQYYIFVIWFSLKKNCTSFLTDAVIGAEPAIKYFFV